MTAFARKASEGALCALIAACPLALGGVPPWTLWPLVALSAIAVVGVQIRLPRLGGFLAVSALFCCLQLLPLPPGLLSAVSPRAGELYDFALAPLGLTHARPLTLDTAATWRELAKHLAYLGAFIAVVDHSRNRRARRRIASALGATGAVLALIGFGHRLTGVHLLFGVEGLISAEPPFLTPFVNPNHLAGFLLLSSTTCLGLALSASERPGMWAWGAAYVTTGAGLLLSLSRGGIACFALAQVTFVAASAWFRRQRPRTLRAPGTQRLLWAAVATVCVGAVGLAIASDDILAELSSADTVEKLSHSKIEFWPMMGRAAWAFGRTGMGRGAFESAFTRYQDRAVEETFTHPENAVLQLACEFGMPAAVLLLALFGVGLATVARERLRQDPSPLDLALLAGAVGLLLHNIVDFNLEFSACAVALWVALGLLSREPRAPSPASEPSPSWRHALPTAAVAAALALFAARAGRGTVNDDERALAAVVAKPGVSAEDIQAAALPLIDHHPADYLLYEMVGRAYIAQRPYRPREALAFLNRVLFLRPIDAEAHRIAAHALLSLHRRSQAFLEYQLALVAAHESGQWGILTDAVSQVRTAQELRAMVPDDPKWIAHAIDQADARGLHEQAKACVTEELALVGTLPAAVPLWLSAARIASAQKDPEGAQQALAAAEKLAPGDVDVGILEAEVDGAAGRPADAVAVLEPLVSLHPASLELGLALGKAHLAAGHPRKAVDALERVRPFVTGNDARALVTLTEADAYARDGRVSQQLDAYRAAARLQPTAAVHHYNAAHVLESLGRSGEALEEIRAGLRLDSAQAAAQMKPWMDALAARKKETEDAMRQHVLLQP